MNDRKKFARYGAMELRFIFNISPHVEKHRLDWNTGRRYGEIVLGKDAQVRKVVMVLLPKH